VLALFFANGLLVATDASRLWLIRDLLNATPTRMGLLLLISSVGAVCFMPLTGTALTYLSKPTFIRLVGAVTVVALLGIGFGAMAHSTPAVAISLFIFGAGVGPMDVAMNVAGTEVEREMGRTAMPQFHAAFSLGTVAAALIGAGLSRLGLALIVHFAGACLVVTALLLWGCAGLMGKFERHRSVKQTRRARLRVALAAWTERRTLLIGLVVLAAGLTEGGANDWLILGIGQDFVVAEPIGIAGLAIFLAFMTSMRILGARLVDRYGRVVVQRLSVSLAVIGLLAYTLAPHLACVMAGAAIWGLGSAMGFPLGLSAAADDPLKAAARTSAVATIGYTAFIAGPALLGLLASHVGYRLALLVILLPATWALALAGVLRPPPQDGDLDRVAT